MACGVLGVVLNEKSERLHANAKVGLSILNHRGETSHGLSFLDEINGVPQLVTRKSMGLVKDSKIFNDSISGRVLIGHTRYTTSSGSNLNNAQPIRFVSKSGVEYAVSHNGNIANSGELKAMLRIEEKGISDTVILGTLLGESLTAPEMNPASIKAELGKAVGSYSLVALVASKDPKIIAIRDSYGYMPLSVGSNQEGVFVASESLAFGKKYLNAIHRPIEPGEMVVISQSDGISSYRLFPHQQRQHCMFQWIYMCRPESVFEGSLVYEVRKRLGLKIAEHYKPDVDFFVPVPDSGNAVSCGYGQANRIPMEGALVKDRYERKRSFMQESHAHREIVVKNKLNVIGAVVEGKRILLIDDSLVRGLTMSNLIFDLRAEGAKEVHVAFSCPPIISQCYFGIDFYNQDLVARAFSSGGQEQMNIEIAKLIGADSVYYTTIDDLAWAIGLPRSSLCISCLTGEYVQDVKPESEASRKM